MKSKKLLIAYFILLATVTGLMYYITTQNRSVNIRDCDEIRREGTLRIITEYSPTGYYISGDTVKGFQYELSQAIANASGLKVEMLLNMSFDESLDMLRKNECDVIARNIPVTAEMREICLFTEPLTLSKHVLVQRKASVNNDIEPIRDHLKLAGKTIYIPQDSPAKLRLKHLESEIGDTLNIIEDSGCSDEQLIIKVAKAEIDYAVCDHQTARSLYSNFPEIDITTDISFTQLRAWAVRKSSPALLDSLNHWLEQIRAEGAFDRIYRQYY